MFEFAISLFTALAALPGLIDRIKDFAAGVAYWYVSKQNAKAAADFANAAALAARAETKDDRINAAKAWHEAFKRSRYSV